ncbi:thiamine pyrophosphate-binding protein [Roseixanthobacter glucoisosaccharinicivorans]|uniref:thiamine pyrophosphate-binding protein n=1 Tax=Roseixanthobacter glucoisosaccharinicivorans TaxID=3119923 RepID=UPI00372CDF80
MHKPSSRARAASQILVDALEGHGLRHAFGVPGESYLPVLDALADSRIDFVVCRQESGAAFMAEAAGKLTGLPGLCFVTRGPGMTNASAGVHVAQQDSTPMILISGQISRGFRHREAFQEIDPRAVFGTMAKLVIEIDDAARIPEFVARAVRVATQGRPGPVVLTLPDDMLDEQVMVEDVPAFEPLEIAPGRNEMARLGALIAAAERPFVIVGGSRWNEKAVSSLVRFAERFDSPVAASFRRQMLFPNDHAAYAGDLGPGANPKLVQRVKDADLVLAFGARLSEMPTQGYSLIPIPNPGVPFVHVHAGVEELGRVFQPTLAINATPAAFAAALDDLEPPADTRRRAWREAAHADYLAWSEPLPQVPGPVQMSTIMHWLRQNLPADTVMCSGAGNFSIWLHRFYRHPAFGTQLAPISGTMGYGFPAAIAAARLNPGRTALCFAGDGDFLMTGQELATAIQYGLAPKVFVIDNGSYGTIRMHQEREFPGRVFGTDLRNPDFAAYACAFGADGFTIADDRDAIPVMEAAFASKNAALIHVKLDTEAISPGTTISALRAKARERG